MLCDGDDEAQARLVSTWENARRVGGADIRGFSMAVGMELVADAMRLIVGAREDRGGRLGAALLGRG